MDEGTRAGSEAVGAGSGEPRSPDEIRRDIDQTRIELGDTVEALVEKADVKAQAKAKADELKQKAAAAKDEVVSRARAASPDSAAVAAEQAAQKAQRNPLPLAVGGGFVAGFVFGRITSR